MWYVTLTTQYKQYIVRSAIFATLNCAHTLSSTGVYNGATVSLASPLHAAMQLDLEVLDVEKNNINI